VRSRDATAACGRRTDMGARARTLRPVASVLAGAEVRHMARQPRCVLGVKMSVDAMPRVTRALCWGSRRRCCGHEAMPVPGGTVRASQRRRRDADRGGLTPYAVGAALSLGVPQPR
jgi:hypothetical protein